MSTLPGGSTELKQASVGAHLKLRDHGDFTESLGGQVLVFLVSEDLMKQQVVRLLKQVDELWWYWVLKPPPPQNPRLE